VEREGDGAFSWDLAARLCLFPPGVLAADRHGVGIHTRQPLLLPPRSVFLLAIVGI